MSQEEIEKSYEKVGTPFYVAPEVWQSRQITKKSDVWSLGVILYELCCLKFPFFATNMDDLEQKVLKEKFAPISLKVPKPLSSLINKLL